MSDEVQPIPESSGNAAGSEGYEVGYKKPPVHTRFGQPGATKKRGRKPKDFDQLRRLAQDISHEPISDGATMTAAEAILRTMAHENPTRFLEIAYGKVPDQSENININLDDLTDEQLEKLAHGGSIRQILTTTSRRRVETETAEKSNGASDND